jgi:hypothetical protein
MSVRKPGHSGRTDGVKALKKSVILNAAKQKEDAAVYWKILQSISPLAGKKNKFNDKKCDVAQVIRDKVWVYW